MLITNSLYVYRTSAGGSPWLKLCNIVLMYEIILCNFSLLSIGQFCISFIWRFSAQFIASSFVEASMALKF